MHAAAQLRCSHLVMAALEAAIQPLRLTTEWRKGWMAGSSPDMTIVGNHKGLPGVGCGFGLGTGSCGGMGAGSGGGGSGWGGVGMVAMEAKRPATG